MGPSPRASTTRAPRQGLSLCPHKISEPSGRTSCGTGAFRRFGGQFPPNRAIAASQACNWPGRSATIWAAASGSETPACIQLSRFPSSTCGFNLLARISHRVCSQVAGARLDQDLWRRTPKNDIHVCNVYYADRPADQPKASEHAGRMSFVALRQCSACPTRLAKYLS
jgi:hypothetical protein